MSPTQPEVDPKAAGECPVIDGFNALDPEISHEDLLAGMARAREQAPVFFEPSMGWYVVCGYKEMEEALRNWETFSVEVSGASLFEVPDECKDRLPEGWPLIPPLAAIDPPEHTRIKGTVQPAFSGTAAEARAEEIRRIANETVDEFIDDGKADLAVRYCRVIPARVIGPLFSVDQEAAKRLHQWSMEAMMLVLNTNLTEEQVVELGHSQGDFDQFVRKLIADRRQNPAGHDDLLTSLINARAEDGGPGLSDSELVSLVVGVISAGTETSTATIGHAVFAMLSDPPLWDRVVADRSLIPSVVEETLRTYPPVRGFHRLTRKDTELGGVEIPAGSMVHMSPISAGHDDSVFPDPDHFDPSRKNVKQHMGFSKGLHFCLGAALARVELRECIDVLTDRMPTMRLVAGSEMRHVPTIGNPSLIEGIHVEW